MLFENWIDVGHQVFSETEVSLKLVLAIGWAKRLLCDDTSLDCGKLYAVNCYGYENVEMKKLAGILNFIPESGILWNWQLTHFGVTLKNVILKWVS